MAVETGDPGWGLSRFELEKNSNCNQQSQKSRRRWQDAEIAREILEF